MPVLTAKMEKQIESLNAKVKSLSGRHLTNTPKRQREQRDRDQKIANYTAQIHVLQYLQEKELAEGLTPFEITLTTASFYETMLARSNYVQHCADHKLSHAIYPPEWLEDHKRLQKAGIMDEAALLSAISQFDDLRKKAVIQPDSRNIQIRDLTYKAQLMQGGDVQFSPPELVSRLLAAVHLDSSSRVLEPEAGTGSIADAVKEVTPHVDCVEIKYDFRTLLELKGHRLIGDDFLNLAPQPVYDAVLMNPPFSQECEHIRHAYDFLKPGGTMAAVCSPRISESTFRKYLAFRDWLASQEHSVQRIQGIKFDMTGVALNFLVIHRES